MRIAHSLPLRHALAIAMSAVAAVAILLAVIVAAREVHRLDRMTANERLTRVVEQLEMLASRSAEQRYQQKVQTAADPVIIALLSGDDVGEDDIEAAIAPLRAPSDSGLPVQVWTRTGALIYSDVAEAVVPMERTPPRHVPLDSMPAYGAFHHRNGEVAYYSTAPVRRSGEVLGWVVQLRRIGNPQAAAQLEDLIGENARVLFHYPGDSLWITLAGGAVPAPVAQPPWDSTIVVRSGGQALLVRARQIRAAQWSVLIEMPAASMGGDRGFPARMLAPRSLWR